MTGSEKTAKISSPMTPYEQARLADDTKARGLTTGFEVDDLDVLHNQMLCIDMERFEADFKRVFEDESYDEDQQRD